MNKQQLIDKAIDDLGGQWPALDFSKPYTVIYYLNCRKDAELATKVTDGGVEVMTKICTKKEFEARKAERESISHWYDYENQKALRLPPVGEVCEMCASSAWISVKVVGDDNGRPVVRYLGSGNYYEQSRDAKFYRPADWNKLRVSAVNELTDIIKSKCVDGVSAFGIADSILAAGYRKCHNKTPSDKE